MSFEGKYYRTKPQRLGDFPRIVFVLKCTNLFRSETVDIVINGPNVNNPWYYRDLHFNSGESHTFGGFSEKQMTEWHFCVGDYVAIIDKKGKIIKRWDAPLKSYAPGECPDCHGSHICKACGGKSWFFNNGGLNPCPVCGGSGKCVTCDAPIRGGSHFIPGYPSGLTEI